MPAPDTDGYERFWENFRGSKQYRMGGSLQERLDKWLASGEAGADSSSRAQRSIMARIYREKAAKAFNRKGRPGDFDEVTPNRIESHAGDLEPEDLQRSPSDGETRVRTRGGGTVPMKDVKGVFTVRGHRVLRDDDGIIAWLDDR